MLLAAGVLSLAGRANSESGSSVRGWTGVAGAVKIALEAFESGGFDCCGLNPEKLPKILVSDAGIEDLELPVERLL